jgi:hypothetical protein
VRTRYRTEADRLAALGATIAVAEEFEASLEVLTQLLARLQVPDDAVDILLERFRRPASGSRPIGGVRRLDELSADLGDLPIAAHQVQGDAWAAGRSLAELDLRAQTALIIATRRGDLSLPSPPPDTRISLAIFFLMGSPADITRAREGSQPASSRSRRLASCSQDTGSSPQVQPGRGRCPGDLADNAKEVDHPHLSRMLCFGSCRDSRFWRSCGLALPARRSPNPTCRGPGRTAR